MNGKTYSKVKKRIRDLGVRQKRSGIFMSPAFK